MVIIENRRKSEATKLEAAKVEVSLYYISGFLLESVDQIEV
jgi:hypothetical protein